MNFIVTAVFFLTLTFSLSGQEFKSEPFGREILTVKSGFNYFGLRFHRRAVATGQVTEVTSGNHVIGLPAEVLEPLMLGEFYLFEVDSGNALGAVIPITSYNKTTGTITLNDDLSNDLEIWDHFTIRPSATLASVFGATNESGMGASASATAADQIWFPDGFGGFEQYHFYNANFSGPVNKWYSIVNGLSGQEVNPHQIPIYYPEGIIIKGNSTVNSFKVSGVLKRTPTTHVIQPHSYHYVSSIYPAGGTIESMFGSNNEAGVIGNDVVFIPSLTGSNLIAYTYQDLSIFGLGAYWMQGSNQIDPSQISFNQHSGYVLLSSAANPRTITVDSPLFYKTL